MHRKARFMDKICKYCQLAFIEENKKSCSDCEKLMTKLSMKVLKETFFRIEEQSLWNRFKKWKRKCLN